MPTSSLIPKRSNSNYYLDITRDYKSEAAPQTEAASLIFVIAACKDSSVNYRLCNY